MDSSMPVWNFARLQSQPSMDKLPEAEPEMEEYIPRPPNCYMIWAKTERAARKKQYPDESFKGINVKLGQNWSTMSIESKTPFLEESRKQNERYEQWRQARMGQNCWLPEESSPQKIRKRHPDFAGLEKKPELPNLVQQIKTKDSGVSLDRNRNSAGLDNKPELLDLDEHMKAMKKIKSGESQNSKNPTAASTSHHLWDTESWGPMHVFYTDVFWNLFAYTPQS
ncbi:Protein CBG28137 [Caenorhabditis briggsae]|uniref:Protein CBG28137 n=1 Tax=Caenorhabditis briggsae TaxID=6238 RepID=B6IHX7_CAEBR|nr:Protein CBG28137 [Caenorhabditis briggsae]CAR99507.1 Protein CBG28137 [Caenorhabditis briggsae]